MDLLDNSENIKKAGILLTKLKNGIIKKPIIIEFLGLPKSGKTTIIAKVEQFFRRCSFITLCPQEGAERIRTVPRKSYLYNIRTGIYALSRVFDAYHTLDYDLVILHRGLYDAYVWMEYWFKREILNHEDKKLFQSFFSHKDFIKFINLSFIVICDQEKAMERELNDSLTKNPGITMNNQTIQILYEIYTEMHEKFKNDNCLIFLDTTDKDIYESCKFVVEEILKRLF